jgi:hypothetical protein
VDAWAKTAIIDKAVDKIAASIFMPKLPSESKQVPRKQCSLQ